MKPSDLYSMPVVNVSHNIYGFVCHHIKEVDNGYLNWEKYMAQRRIEIRCHGYHDFDHRRYWDLSSVWFDNKPVMIIQNAGREGDDHNQRFVTDAGLYVLMNSIIKTLLDDEAIEISDLVSVDDDISSLDRFCRCTLEQITSKNS